MSRIIRVASLRLFIVLLVAGITQAAYSQDGLIMNEASNGSAGAKEFYELVLVGDGANCFVDLRGWIIDDNNGDFSCGPRSSAGIAPGHARFSTTDMTWSAVPLGAVILVYNDGDVDPGLPANDPTDSNNDLVYVVPISHSSIEVANGGSSTPNGAGSTCPGTGNSGYAGNTYTNGGAWNMLGMRNGGGDAAQTRDPSGAYFHGISYGSTNITGGPDNLQVSTSSGSGTTYYFSGGDFRDVTNFTAAPALGTQTPGSPNDAANATFITNMQICPLPVEFEKNLVAFRQDGHIALQWATSSESYFSHFVVERATEDGLEFEPIGQVSSQGEVALQGENSYGFIDQRPAATGTQWYRLRIVDQDGSINYSRIAAIYPEVDDRPLQVRTFPNPARETFNFLIESDEAASVRIFDLQGMEVYRTNAENTLQVPVSNWESGVYFWKISTGNEVSTGKIQLL